MLGRPLRAKGLPCKYLENRSGGTRTRTGHTMIFSPSPYVLACPRVSGNWAYLCDFRRFLRSRFSALFGSVLARLQYDCSKLRD